MADVEYTKFGQIGRDITLVAVEQGDGTFAERVALVGSSVTVDGEVTVGGTTKDGGPDTGAGTMESPVHGDFSSATDVSAAPTSGQKLVITDVFISTAVACEVSLKEETSGTVVFGPILMPANGYAQFTPRGKLKLATADKKVQGFSSASDDVTIQISVYSEA